MGLKAAELELELQLLLGKLDVRGLDAKTLIRITC
jgi:hypothetical protein